MKKSNVVELEKQAEPASNPLEAVLRQGAARMLQQAIENEVAEYVQRHQAVRDEAGLRQVVRNGWMPERKIQTGLGPIPIRQPRVDDRGQAERFSSKILPPYLRRTPSLDAPIPALYLRGVSTGDFSEALSAILGPKAAGLSPTNIVRLKEGWEGDYAAWQTRDLSGKEYVYWWADGIYFNVRLTPDRPCVLVIVGSLADGTKELVAVMDDYIPEPERAVDVKRSEATGIDSSPEAGGGRRGDGVLGRLGRRVSFCAGAAMLGAQDGQRSR